MTALGVGYTAVRFLGVLLVGAEKKMEGNGTFARLSVLRQVKRAGVSVVLLAVAE